MPRNVNLLLEEVHAAAAARTSPCGRRDNPLLIPAALNGRQMPEPQPPAFPTLNNTSGCATMTSSAAILCSGEYPFSSSSVLRFGTTLPVQCGWFRRAALWYLAPYALNRCCKVCSNKSELKGFLRPLHSVVGQNHHDIL
jgi:hypothetical protein